MKKIKYQFLAVLALVIASSCSNFEDLNSDPNKTEIVTPEMLATTIMKDAYRFWNPNASDFASANLWCKHTTLTDGTNPNPYQYYYSYWPYGGFGNYKKLTDCKRMVEFAQGTESAPSYEGLALFMKASYGFIATLDMGDVPYSEAGKAEEGIMRPKYDKQADVFVAILNDLKAAEALFAKGKNFKGDIMFNGSAKKWQQLCNAMQLKVLQTMSKKITTEQKARFAEIVAANNLMKNNDDSFLLKYSENPNSSYPYYDGTTKRLKNAVSNLVVDKLKELKDRRLFYFAEPSDSMIVKEKKLPNDYDAYIGAPTEMNYKELEIKTSRGWYSLLNKRYPLMRTGDPMIKFSYAEQCFIIAEAIEEGWVSGDSKTYYENGVKAMLDYYMRLNSSSASAVYTHGMAIDQAYIDGYFTGAAAYAATKGDRLKQIWDQRWLIDFFQGNGLNYPQVLRTGYPVFPLDPATSMNPEDKSKYPKRWKYPTGEQTTNPVNYDKAIKDQYNGFDAINGTPWYLQ
ncbi:hypothetical protein A9168_13870 [Macellibacteroides sp. HH-ZS]|nr:hypothetical protein A9168_13870 [Macellibacteroides sp. HH-ZS]